VAAAEFVKGRKHIFNDKLAREIAHFYTADYIVK